MAPRIGISMSPDLIDGRAVFALNRAYADAVRGAGGVPLLLPALGPEDLDSVLGCLDGVLLSGGGDLDPARYGAEAEPEVACVDADRDVWELALARAALARDLPLLGICRGVQVLNVALGGTLVQDVPTRTGQVHRVADRFAEAVHDVVLQPGSAMAAVLGGSVTIGVNSLHHQAVDRLGEGLRAVGWAGDGTVEAVEGTGGRRVLGVQWHPELLVAERAHAALFAWLVEESVRSTSVLPLHGHAGYAHPAQAHATSANATVAGEFADVGAVAANFSDSSADAGRLPPPLVTPPPKRPSSRPTWAATVMAVRLPSERWRDEGRYGRRARRPAVPAGPAASAGLARPAGYEDLNRYSTIIIDEALRRGITVEVVDPVRAELRLRLGDRAVTTLQSLSELTSVIAFQRCDHKLRTREVLGRAGLVLPAGRLATSDQADLDFLAEFGDIVVKPAQGEQGWGVTVGVTSPDQLARAREAAAAISPEVLLEQRVDGQDLRILVIGGQVVAASVRRPAQVVGTGRDTVGALVEAESEARSAATGGASTIPLDDTTAEVVAAAGHDLGTVLPEGEVLVVRRTANLHTGGTIHDVTDELHPALAEVAVRAAEAIAIPVLGLDLMVTAVDGADYRVIEANEQPGLANHEPRPTAERFIDLLFPETAS